ncbi:hypothetical protein [Pelagibius sp.]|uniref:hypothetical protein n=1 Tax=Pelagibius sp. TaxID=1931238 RepID=UPI003BB06DF2
MAGTFSAAVDRWTLKTKRRTEAVFRTATQYVVEDVLERTPVDTGYLRASLTVTFNGPVPARGQQGDGYMAPPFALVIAGAQLGQVIYASFGANYALPVEYGKEGREGAGMVRLAAQAWPQHVAKAVAEAKAAVKGS